MFSEAGPGKAIGKAEGMAQKGCNKPFSAPHPDETGLRRNSLKTT
jgi:hypothetical protein